MARITLIATGGTRAPSQLDLLKRFLADGHEVRCLASKNALRFLTSYLVRRPQALPGYLRRFRPQLLETFAYYHENVKKVPHIWEGKWADVVVMCPASCNSVGKLAAGMNDNYPLQVIRAVPRGKHVIVVPSMNPEMWFDPQFQRNADLLNATEKYRVICPSRGLMLSGDYGFGAQATLDDIVAATYGALGILDEEVEAVFTRAQSVPWAVDKPASEGPTREIVLIDEDEITRSQLAAAVSESFAGYQTHQFAAPREALAAFRDRNPDLVVTEMDFSGGASVEDIVTRFRTAAGGSDVQLIAVSGRDRRDVGAEALARDDILFLPKPINLQFAVGMIGGCLTGSQHQPRVQRRSLESGEVLFTQGDIGSTLYVIESGRLSIVKKGVNRDIPLRTVGEGEIVGEMAFFSANTTRTASAVALEPTCVLCVRIDSAREYLARQPAWLRRIVVTLADRVLENDRTALAAADRELDENLLVEESDGAGAAANRSGPRVA